MRKETSMTAKTTIPKPDNRYPEKPYDRFLYAGPTALSDAELLAIILRTGRKGADAVSVAKEVLDLAAPYGLAGLNHLSIQDIMKVSGIGEIKAVKLKCVAELSRRIVMNAGNKKIAFRSPGDFATFYMESMRHLEKENCLCIFLDGSMNRLKDVTISIGSVNASIISSREVFMEALRAKAVYIVLLHNHPSGNATPSNADKEVTNRIYQASLLMDIPLLDHIIIGDNCYYSFKENNLIT